MKVPYRDNDENQVKDSVRVVDWRDPENNDFSLASQLWFSGDMYRRRCDLVGFVNGIPLLFIELKATRMTRSLRLRLPLWTSIGKAEPSP